MTSLDLPPPLLPPSGGYEGRSSHYFKHTYTHTLLRLTHSRYGGRPGVKPMSDPPLSPLFMSGRHRLLPEGFI